MHGDGKRWHKDVKRGPPCYLFAICMPSFAITKNTILRKLYRRHRLFTQIIVLEYRLSVSVQVNKR